MTMIIEPFQIGKYEVSLDWSPPWTWGNPLSWIFDYFSYGDLTILTVFGLQIGALDEEYDDIGGHFF